MSHYNPEDGGIQFDPYDDELIKRFLIPKLKGERYPFGDKIVMKDVYAKEPWLLDHTRDSFFKKNEWYYFATRTQVSKKKIGFGQKANRKITGDNDGGTWKANDTEDIIDEETEMVIGKKQTLKFTNDSDKNKKKKRGDGTSCDIIARGSDSSWIMTEYLLPEKDGTFQTPFQMLVLCKIHVIKKSKDDHHESFSSSEQQPITTDHGSVLGSSFSDELQQKLSMNEAHRRYAEIPRIGAEKNDQVIGRIQESYKSKKKDDHQEASTYRHYLDSSTSDQRPMNVDNMTVLSPSLEQQQPSLSGPENPHMGFLNPLTCSAAETERNEEQSGEGNMINQIDAISMIDTLPGRSSHKDGKFEAMEVTQELKEERIGDPMNKYASNGLEVVLMTNTDDQQEPPISAPAHVNVVASARLEAKSLPKELDEDSESYKECVAAFAAMIRDEEEAPFTRWWDPLLIHVEETQALKKHDCMSPLSNKDCCSLAQ